MKRYASYLTLYAAMLLVAACAGGQLNAPTASQSVFAAKQGYEVALSVAVAYRNLPACAVPVKMPCHDTKILQQLRLAQPAVRATLDAAESAVRDTRLAGEISGSSVVAAQSALKAFVAITSTLQVK